MRRTIGGIATDRLSAALWSAINSMTDRELRAAFKTVRAFSQTNCGWWEYRMRETWAEMIEAEIGKRKADAKRGRR